MGIKKTVFFDSKLIVDAYIKNKVLDEANTLLIAMNPTIHSYLKQKGFKVQNTLPYFTNDSHIKALKKSKEIIDWLINNSDFINLNSCIKFAFRDSFIFYTRFAIHYCLWMIEVISNAVDMHKPEVISASFSNKKNVLNLYIEPEERYLGYIGDIIAHQMGLKYEDISIKGISNYNINRLTNHLIYLKNILKYGSFQLWKLKMVLKGLFTNEKPVFFTTTFYQMDKLAESIKQECPNKEFYFLSGPVIPSFKAPDLLIKLLQRKYSKAIINQKKLLEDLIATVKKETELFSYRNISFADIISQKIKDNISEYVLGLILWSIVFNRFIDKSNASGFISNGNRADDVMLAELCQEKNIPTILISHGSHVRPKNECENIEWGEHGRLLLRAPFSHLALQSPLSEGYFEVFSTKSKTIKTGPLLWGMPVNFEKSKLLFKRIFDGKYNFRDIKVILHASTPKPSNSLRFHVYETPDEYIQTLCDIANAVEKIPDTIFMIKFRPSTEIGVSDLRTIVPFSEKVMLSVDEPFLDALGMADLLVSFSSTCIEEALQNRIPVLFYGGGGRYQHIPSCQIRTGDCIKTSAVYHVNEANDLEYGIKGILDLNINKKQNCHLFDPYIYHQNERVPVADLLNL